MAKTITTSQLKKLQQENRQLRAENKALHQRPALIKKSPPRGRAWRKAVVLSCISLAGALLIAGNVLFWMGNTLLDNSRYTQTVAPLIKEPAVQTAIADYATTQLYKNVDIQQLTAEVLPPRASFLAPSLSGQIEGATRNVLLRVLQNPSFQQTWNSAQTKAHSRFVSFVKNYQGDGTIDISDIYQQLSQHLAQTKFSFLANKSLPANIGTITLINASWLPTAHTIAVHIGLYQFLASLLVIGLLALAIYLAANRRRTAISISLVFTGLLFCVLVALKLLQASIVAHVNPQFKDATRIVANHVAYPLVLQTRTLLLLSVLLGLVAWVSGPYPLAVNSRKRFQQLAAGNLHRAIVGGQENKTSRWVGAHKRSLQWASIAIVAIIMLLVQLSPGLVIGYALLMLLLVASIEVLAMPV